MQHISDGDHNMVKQFKVIVEKYPDGYVAHPLGFKGIIVGEGDTYEEVFSQISVDTQTKKYHLK